MKQGIPVLILSAVLGGVGGIMVKRSSPPAAGEVVSSGTSPQVLPSDANSSPAGKAVSGSASASGSTSADRKAPPLGPGPTLEELRAAPAGKRVPLLVRWLPHADAAQIAALAGEWFAGSKDCWDGAWQALAQRWVELDTPAALAYGRKISQSSEDTDPLSFVYLALGRIDLDRALTLLAGETSLWARSISNRMVTAFGADKVRLWALSVPGRPDLDFLRTLKNDYKEPDLSNPAKAAASLSEERMPYDGAKVAAEWAKKDPAAALAWAKDLKNSLQSAQMLSVIASTLSATDPGKALEVIQSLQVGATRTRAEAAYVTALAKKDPQAALAYAEGNLHGLARMQGIAAAAGVLAESDPAGALRLLREQGIGDLSVLLRSEVKTSIQTLATYYPDPDSLNTAFKSAAASDPAGVMQLLADTGSLRPPGWWEQEQDRDRSQSDGYLGRSIFKDWAAKDPAAAARWAAAQPAGEALQDLANSAAATWFGRSPAEVQAFAASLPAGSGKDRFVQAAASLMARDDPAGALAWTSQNGSAEALSSVFGSVAKSNPAVAAAQFSTLPPDLQAKQAQTLTDTLGKTSPSAAVSFYQALPEARQAELKLYETTMAYARQDPEAASEWIRSLPPTNAKDSAISGLVNYLISQASDPDPEGAAYWAAASVDPAGRDRRLKRVAEVWFQRDPAGAAAAIQSTDLADEVKQTLLSHAPVQK